MRPAPPKFVTNRFISGADRFLPYPNDSDNDREEFDKW